MRDYYVEYVSNHGKKREGLDAQGAKGAKDASAPFAPFLDCESSKITPDEDSESVLYIEQEQSIIFEERVAIMMFDGGLREEEATEYLTNRQKRTVLPGNCNEHDLR